MKVLHHLILMIFIFCYGKKNKGILSGFREDFLIGKSQRRTAYGGYITCMIGTKYGNFVENLPYKVKMSSLLVSEEKNL
jgi:hypothetical protein